MIDGDTWLHGPPTRSEWLARLVWDWMYRTGSPVPDKLEQLAAALEQVAAEANTLAFAIRVERLRDHRHGWRDDLPSFGALDVARRQAVALLPGLEHQAFLRRNMLEAIAEHCGTLCSEPPIVTSPDLLLSDSLPVMATSQNAQDDIGDAVVLQSFYSYDAERIMQLATAFALVAIQAHRMADQLKVERAEAGDIDTRSAPADVWLIEQTNAPELVGWAELGKAVVDERYGHSSRFSPAALEAERKAEGERLRKIQNRRRKREQRR